MSKLDNPPATSIYRYKFSEPFVKQLKGFTKVHRFDDAIQFKESWDKWIKLETVIIAAESRRLRNMGYTGNVIQKMYKSARYYFKDKSSEKKKPKKRRVYISLDREILDSMDSHIQKNSNIKPSVAYQNYLSTELTKNRVDSEVKKMENVGLEKDLAEEKIKKTYKNRFFIHTKD